LLAKKFKKEHELSAVDLQPSTDKNGIQNEKICVRKGEIKNNKKNNTI